MKYQKLFKIFLFLYLIFLIIHATHMDWGSMIVPFGVILGFGFAILSHTRWGMVTIGLLVIHIGLEWFQHARHGSHYTNREIVFHALHALLDLVFLFHEIKVRFPRRYQSYFSILVGCLAIFFMSNYQEPIRNPILARAYKLNHDHRNPYEPFLLGGLAGCATFHLFRRRPSGGGDLCTIMQTRP